ncbi:MAG: hypothetical protein LBS16_07790 [Prevotellaceae bacterium]|jgi:hypothetical protein|nr:hypothetical protein [Prevotellaceae bacterium]
MKWYAIEKYLYSMTDKQVEQLEKNYPDSWERHIVGEKDEDEKLAAYLDRIKELGTYVADVKALFYP